MSQSSPGGSISGIFPTTSIRLCTGLGWSVCIGFRVWGLGLGFGVGDLGVRGSGLGIRD
jgi:hypothetical protein